MKVKNASILSFLLLFPLFMSFLSGNIMLAIEILVIGILLWIEIEQ